MGQHSRARLSARLPVKSAVGAATALAATAGAFAAAAPADAATPAHRLAHDLARLRMCESGGDYSIDTGNGFYGAYQFDLGTWQGLGYSGRPSNAAPAVQNRAAARLEFQRGWEPWPACSAELGLTPIASIPLAPASVNQPVVVHRAHHSAGRHGVLHIPGFRGTVLTTRLVHARRADVMLWQARMAARGWPISVDGFFGRQSASIAAQFTAEFHIKTAFPGQVDKAVWRAAWAIHVVH
jgi:hypothetical protein